MKAFLVSVSMEYTYACNVHTIWNGTQVPNMCFIPPQKCTGDGILCGSILWTRLLELFKLFKNVTSIWVLSICGGIYAPYGCEIKWTSVWWKCQDKSGWKSFKCLSINGLSGRIKMDTFSLYICRNNWMDKYYMPFFPASTIYLFLFFFFFRSLASLAGNKQKKISLLCVFSNVHFQYLLFHICLIVRNSQMMKKHILR